MIAKRMRFVSILVAVVCVAGALARSGAWAQDVAQTTTPATGQATAPDWAALDAQVEVGVKTYDAGDYPRAKEILMPLAERGHPWAMNTIGLMHNGTDVFPNDPKLECDWYEKAAKAGFASGIYNLSICFNHGIGRPKDFDQMLFWRTKAAEMGFTPAMINLAALDTKQGAEYRRWMNMAAEHGSRYAPVSLWLQGYESDAWSQGMTIQDMACVFWHVLILDKDADYCD